MNKLYNFKNKDTKDKKFGKLLAIEYKYHKNGKDCWLCKCDCGNERIYIGKNLRSGLSKSCGCVGIQKRREKFNLVGRKFAFLYVICKSGKTKNGLLKYECICDCGNKKIVTGSKLTNNHTKSCGCLHKKKCAERAITRNKLMSGPNHPKWRKDLTKEDRFNNRNRNLNPKLWRWRTKIFKKYNYECQKCHVKSVPNLVAHHIYSWAKYKSLRFVTNNGICFCEDCHKRFHNIYGYGNNNKKQLSKFLILD